MTFTYAGTLDSDRELVRFWTGDTTTPGFVTDEGIAVLLTSEGSVGATVIACLQAIAAQLARPDFKADWLSVSNADALKCVMAQLAAMRTKFAIPKIAAESVHVYRADSLATEEPDYDEGAADA